VDVEQSDFELRGSVLDNSQNRRSIQILKIIFERPHEHLHLHPRPSSRHRDDGTGSRTKQSATSHCLILQHNHKAFISSTNSALGHADGIATRHSCRTRHSFHIE
jgi:hypothetical protein